MKGTLRVLRIHKTNDPIKGVVHHYRYIRFPDKTFLKNVKILKAKARDSRWYWTYPYILEIEYAKQWDEETYIQVGKTPVAVTEHHNTIEYTFKYDNIDSMADKIREMRKWEVEVENEIKPTINTHHT